MVTNINLVSPENENKMPLSGRATLLFSAALVVLILGIYGAISYLEKKYVSEKNRLETEIQAEKAKMNSPGFAALADFQERLDLLGKIIGDHAYWDEYLKRLSKYILPEIRLTDFSSGEKADTITLKGVAPNFEALSRGIILLQKSPEVESIEFKSAGEKTETEGQTGIDFELAVKANKDAFKTDFSGTK